MLWVFWYGFAAVLAAVVWRQSRGLRSWRQRWVVRAGALALGFTTVPLGRDGDGDGGLYPIGLYYLAFGRDWLEAAGGATIVIGLVWVVLAAAGLIIGWLAERARALRK